MDSFKVIDIDCMDLTPTVFKEKKEEDRVIEESVNQSHLVKRSAYDGKSWNYTPVVELNENEGRQEFESIHKFKDEGEQDRMCDMFINSFAEKSRFRWVVIRMLKKFFPEYINIGPLTYHSTKFFHSDKWWV